MAKPQIPTPDPDLITRLTQAGSRHAPEELQAMMAGILAAPTRTTEPEAWMSLVVESPAPKLVDALRAYRDRARAAADDGLAAGKAATPARLAALREHLASEGLDGFFVPRADAHQGEFVPPHAQRLRWLTGFSGSAGMAVVTADKVALFVDGRYTLQAGNEVDTHLVTVVDSGETRPEDWLAVNLPPEARIGYDAWLHTPRGLSGLRDSAGKAGAHLVAVAANPVDAVWPEQPAAPVAPVEPHDLAYAGESSLDKRRRLSAALAEADAKAAVLTLPDSLAWLLNLRGADIPHTPVVLSFGIAHDDGALDWFVDARKLTAKARAALDPAVRIQPPDAFGPALESLGAREGGIVVDPASAPVAVSERLAAAGGTVKRRADPVQGFKACKNATELAGTRAAHRRDGAAVTEFLAWLDRHAAARAKAGEPVTEMEAASVLASFRQVRDPYRDASFETISGAGEHGAIVHYRVTPESDRPLKTGELFLCDSGGQYLDGTTDITRTVAVGEPTAEMQADYTRVLRGLIAISTLRFPKGTTGSQIDAFARRPLWEVGLDYAHGTGHGVGSFLGVHEGPQRISKMPGREALRPGMICSNEPGFYKAGAYGIRIENLIAVQPAESVTCRREGTAMQSFETLTLAPLCRALIDTDLLTAAEVGWIDNYHRRVREELTPLLDDETAAWLDDATQPLA